MIRVQSDSMLGRGRSGGGPSSSPQRIHNNQRSIRIPLHKESSSREWRDYREEYLVSDFAGGVGKASGNRLAVLPICKLRCGPTKL
jgi:hypothetical protein